MGKGINPLTRCGTRVPVRGVCGVCASVRGVCHELRGVRALREADDFRLEMWLFFVIILIPGGNRYRTIPIFIHYHTEHLAIVLGGL